MNLISVKVTGNDGGLYAETTNGLGEEVRLKFPEPSAALKSYEGRTITLGIRPEAITDAEGADRNARHLEQITSRVIVTEPAGSDTFVMTSLGGNECNARMRADVQVQPITPHMFGGVQVVLPVWVARPWPPRWRRRGGRSSYSNVANG